MFNEKLREVYSEGICNSLKDVADFFEERNIVAYAYGLKGEDFNIKAPYSILFDCAAIKSEARMVIGECLTKFTSNLSAEDAESFGGLTCAWSKSIWSDHINTNEVMLELWV